MTQDRILRFMRKNDDEWLTTKQIAKAMKQMIPSTSLNLRKLYEEGLILRSEIRGGVRRNPYVWRLSYQGREK